MLTGVPGPVLRVVEWIPFKLLVFAAVVVVLAFDYTNGFHDAANIIATPIALRAATPVQAVAIVALFEGE